MPHKVGKDGEIKGLYKLQLRTLIWKNFVLKKRNVAFLCVEFLCPLLLFLIIVIIRADQPPEKKPNCHLLAKVSGKRPALNCFSSVPKNGSFSFSPQPHASFNLLV